MRNIFIITITIGLLWAYTNNVSSQTIGYRDTIVEHQLNNIEEIKSYFPDMILGKDGGNERRLLPNRIAYKLFGEEYEEYEESDETEDTEEAKLYAVGKIENYRGLDLFIYDYEYERPDEDSYDNHVDGIRYLLVFKDGKPLMKYENDVEKQVTYLFSSSYYGEGGSADYESYFDKDTTIVSSLNKSESESATGYEIPIISKLEDRSRLSENGDMEIIELIRIEFSSPFYDQAFLKEYDEHWKKMENMYRPSHPRKEDKWNLEIEWLFRREASNLVRLPLELHFYNERVDGKLTAVFESYKDKEMIDRYTLGQSKKISSKKKGDSNQAEILKCPIIIKTSDGDLELLPNGKFMRVGK